MRYALVNKNTNIVDNIIIWDGNCPVINFNVFDPILLNMNEECNIGYSYDPNFDPRFFASDFHSIIF